MPPPPASEPDLRRRLSFASQTAASLDLNEDSTATALLTVLRNALATGGHAPETILRAIADTARILTGANGTAIALRTNGEVVCRARSGDVAPELGALLNVDSGISGECFRLSRVLRCDDTESDNRVEPEVCRTLGIRSIAAVPLRAAEGAFGIIEAFSSQPSAFAHEQIKSLEDLGEIAEAALLQESRAKISTPPLASSLVGLPEILAASTARPERTSAARVKEAVRETKRRSWILGGAVALVVMALPSAVVWWTWHESVGKSARQSTAQTHATLDTSNVAGAVVLPLQPSPTAGSEKAYRSRTNGVVRNAASIQPLEDAQGTRGLSAPTKNFILPAASRESPLRSSAAIPPLELPSLVAATAANSEPLGNIVSPPPSLPRLEITISQGVKEANLIHQVAPVYPWGALVRHLEGAVNLEVSIAEDGTIGAVKILSGQPLLAAAAVTAIHQWRYTPSLLNGKPVSVQKKITVDFKLH
ncbi:MAG: TonB family protein [Candidatus Sulfotelmatobacter sp.]